MGVSEPPAGGWTWDAVRGHREAADRQGQGHVRHRLAGGRRRGHRVAHLAAGVAGRRRHHHRTARSAFGGAPRRAGVGVVNRLAQDGSVYVDTKPGLRPDLPAVQQRQDRRWSSTGPWQLPDFIDAQDRLRRRAAADVRRRAADDLGARHVDAVRQRRRAREGGAIEFVQWLNAARAGRAAGSSRRARCRCARAPREQAVWKDVPGQDARAVGLRGRARRRAHASRPTPRYPQVSEPGRAVARRRAAASARRRRTRCDKAVAGRSDAGPRRRRLSGGWPSPSSGRPSRTQRVFGETPTAWLWVAPAVVIILGLSLVPMAWALLLSFQHNDLVTPSTWIGLRNYRRLLARPDVPRRGPAHADLHGGCSCR